MWVDFVVGTTRDKLFHWRKRYYGLWTYILARSNSLKLKFLLMMDLFLTNTQLLSSQDVNWWTGVDCLWIIVMLLSAVWTLILTAPIHCRGSIGEQVMQCYISPNLLKKQTHLHRGWHLRESKYSEIFAFGWNIPLITLNSNANCFCWAKTLFLECEIWPLLVEWLQLQFPQIRQGLRW